LSSLPDAIEPIAWISPLWHGVDLARGLALGTAADAPLLMLAHVAVLVGITAAGTWWAMRTIERRLVRG
jgi:lipooligosaccharide transport system permease protein